MVVHYRVHKIPPLDPNLGHINQLYPTQIIPEISVLIILHQLILGTTYNPFPTDVATEILYTLLNSLPRDRCSVILIFDSPSLKLLI